MIYPALLEESFEKLPPVLRKFHSTPGRRCASGVLTIRRHNALLAWLVRFPSAGDGVPIRLEVEASDDQEVWTRWFGGEVRSSTQRASGGLLVETAGPLRISFRLRADEHGMQFDSCRASILGIPVPLRVTASTHGGEDSWDLEVNVAHVGSYRGTITVTP